MNNPNNSEEAKAHKKKVAGKLLQSCGLEKIELGDGSTGFRSIGKKQIFAGFKPSAETQPLGIPFARVERDGMGVPNPPIKGENE